MSEKGYPKSYSYQDIDIKDLRQSKSHWLDSRGFVPKNPLVFKDLGNSIHLAIPLYDRDNRLISFQLRDINDTNVDTKYKLTKKVYDGYVKTDDLDLQGRLVLCEGTIDSMVLRKHGINAWTCLGLKKFKIERILDELDGDKFIYITDNDSLGNYFAKKVFNNHGLCYKVPPVALDINDLFKNQKSLFIKWCKDLKCLTLT